MTEQQRAAMQQALEAMLHFPGDISDEMFESIRSLKAALAEPQTVNEAHEACELLKRMGFKWYELENSWYPSAPAKPEPEPEPVAWQCREHGDGEWVECSKEAYGINSRRYEYRRLYTTPPARRPLPYAEIDRIADSIDPSTLLRVGKRLFARAVERAHGIGGNDE